MWNVVGFADILQHVARHAAVVDQPVGVAYLAFLDPLAHGIDNVGPLFGLDGKVGIARDPYRIVRVDVESREDDVEVQGNHVVDKHHVVLSVVRSELDKPRHFAERNLYLGIERLSVGVVAFALPIHFDGQVEPVVAQERDDVVFQYQHRLQEREYLFFKEVTHLVPVALLDFLLMVQHHTLALEFGDDVVEKEFVEVVDLLVDFPVNRLQGTLGLLLLLVAFRRVRQNLVILRNPHAIKFLLIRLVYRQKPDAVEQRHRLVHGLHQYPVIER